MNFALILFLLTVVTGLIALADRVMLRRNRPLGQPDPWWIEYPKSFFPVLLIVFLLRSFIAEPFKIPSSSMRPTLEVGDFILVNKFAYGIRLPIVEKKIIPLGEPQRGDVIVFRYPVLPSQDFIKRLVDSTPKDVMQRIARRIADLGWHIVIYFEHADLDEMAPFLKSSIRTTYGSSPAARTAFTMIAVLAARCQPAII